MMADRLVARRGEAPRTSVCGGNLLSCGWFKSESSVPGPLSFTSALEMPDGYPLGCEMGPGSGTTGSALRVRRGRGILCLLSSSRRAVENWASPYARGSHPTVSLPAPGHCFRGQPAVKRLEWVMGAGVPSGCKLILCPCEVVFVTLWDWR